MAKKQKRNVSQGTRTAAEVNTIASSVTNSAPARTSYVAEFNPDYTYVKKDLKKIAILAVSFISILVVLSFFLR
jgi:hypothetical protein